MKVKPFNWKAAAMFQVYTAAMGLLIYLNGGLIGDMLKIYVICVIASLFFGVGMVWPAVVFEITEDEIWACRFGKRLYSFAWAEWETIGIFPLAPRDSYYVYLSPRSVEEMRSIKCDYYSSKRYNYEAIAFKFGMNYLMGKGSLSLREVGERDLLLVYAGSYYDCLNVCKQILSIHDKTEQNRELNPLNTYHFPKLMY